MNGAPHNAPCHVADWNGPGSETGSMADAVISRSATSGSCSAIQRRNWASDSST